MNQPDIIAEGPETFEEDEVIIPNPDTVMDALRDGADIDTAMARTVTPTSDGEAETSEDTSEESETVETTSDKPPRRAGYDQVLSTLQDQPELLETVKDLINQNRELKSLDVEKIAREAAMAAVAPEPEEPPLPEGFSDEDLAAFSALADRLGFAKTSDIDTLETKRTQTDYLTTLHRKAAEEFGEKFGSVAENGTVTLNPDVVPVINETAQRLQDASRGATYADFYKVATYDDAVAEAEQRGYEKGLQERGVKTAQRQRAVTESPGTALPSNIRIRGEKGTASDGNDAAWKRSYLAAKAQVKKLGVG